MSGKKVAASLTAQNTFSNAIKFCGLASFVLSGTWTATVTPQRTKDAGATWDDVTDSTGAAVTYTANVTVIITEPVDSDDVQWRFGVKTGNYTNGTVVGVIAQ